MTSARSIKIAEAGERTTALRRARVNSLVVHVLRWVLPVVAVLLLCSYALFMQRTIRVETKLMAGKLNTGTVSASLDNLAMTNPSYEGFNKKNGSRYKISAKRAITDLSRDKPIELEDLHGSVLQLDGQRTAMEAKHGSFDQVKGTLALTGGIQIAAPNGLAATLSSAKIDTKTAEVTSSEPVLVQLPAGEVRSNGMRLDQRSNEILFQNGVAARLKPPAQSGPTADAAQPILAGEEPGAVLGFGGGSRAPVDITSATLSVVEKQRRAQFMGSVRAVQSGRTLETPSLTVIFDQPAAKNAAAGTGPGTPVSMASGGRLQRIVARGGVRLSQGGNEVRAGEADFNAVSQQAELSGNVHITAPSGRSINAKQATVDMASNKVVLTGNVIAKQAESLLRGNQMVYEPKQGRMRLSSPPIEGAPRGNIFVRFRAADQNGRSSRRSRRPNPAVGSNSAFSTNPDAPIEISATALDVQDARSTARFNGGVRARQGDFKLRTPVLTAHYDGQIGLFSDAGATEGSKRKAPMKLRYIRATNPVAVSSGTDMKANGERAEFDMAANTVTISGNVVLQRGRQIIRGDRLIIDLKTGLSRMKNAAPEKNTAKRLTFGTPPRITANPGQRDCGGQMCAVFFPQDLEKEQTARNRKTQRAGRSRVPKGNAAPRKPRLDSGWSTTTNTN